MLSAIALIPSAPVMVPELATGAAGELQELVAAVARAAAELPNRWFVVGLGAADDVIGPAAVGTFGGYGADVRVGLSPEASAAVRPLPLCALVAGWVRQNFAPAARAETWVYDSDHGVEAALARGRALRAEVDAVTEPVGVLVVADGANTLVPSAPGGYDPGSVAVQSTLDDALATGDVTPLTALPTGVVGRVAYQVLAGVAGSTPMSAHQLYRGAPYGVGYFVGVWRP